MSYYRAPVLDQMVRDVNNRWPKRDHKSDGWIGDAAHQKRKSDHNPDWSSRPPGVVRAEDFDNDGVHVPTLLAGLLLHPATRYVIYQRKIWHRDRKMKPAVYKGVAHLEHLHDSIQPGTERSTSHLPLVSTVPNWGAGVRAGLPRSGASRECQAYLNAYGAALVLDGDFGPASEKALRAFQHRHGLTVDGIAGPRTLAKMRTA